MEIVGIEKLKRLDNCSFQEIQKELSNKIDEGKEITIMDENGKIICFYNNKILSNDSSEKATFRMLSSANERTLIYIPRKFFGNAIPLTSRLQEIISVVFKHKLENQNHNIYLV